MTARYCRVCNKLKRLTEFRLRIRNGRIYIAYQCKMCVAQKRHKHYRKLHPKKYDRFYLHKKILKEIRKSKLNT
jgi:hypothetical protein